MKTLEVGLFMHTVDGNTGLVSDVQHVFLDGAVGAAFSHFFVLKASFIS